jgi:hypothetical protein
MAPDIYEQLAREHRQTLLREAEQERLLAERQRALPSVHRLKECLPDAERGCKQAGLTACFLTPQAATHIAQTGLLVHPS